MGTVGFDDVGVFVVVVEAASFSIAAKRLGIPKSSVSRAIARLEAATGARLLHRTTRQVSLSSAGRALYDRVHAEVASLRHAVGDLPPLEAELAGSVRVTTVVDMPDFFAEVVSRFVTRYPAVEVDLRLSNERVDLVADGIDLALRFSTTRLKDSSLNAQKLSTNGVDLFASPVYLARKGVPRIPSDLDRHDWVVRRRTSEVRLQKGRETAAVRITGRIICNDFSFVRAALLNGCGIGYLGSPQVEADVAAGRLVRVLPEWNSPSSSLWAVWPGPRRLSRRAAAFLDAVHDTIRAHPLAFWNEAPPIERKHRRGAARSS